jgi:rRNA-processing protein EBP2
VRFSLFHCPSSDIYIFGLGKKNIKVRYIMRKRMTAMPFKVDVAVEDAIADRRPAKRARGGKVAGGSSLPRHVGDKKFGFGGHGKREKQNTRSSTDDFDGSARRGSSGGARGSSRGRGRGGKGHGSTRLGKSRREAARSRS